MGCSFQVGNKLVVKQQSVSNQLVTISQQVLRHTVQRVKLFRSAVRILFIIGLSFVLGQSVVWSKLV